MYLRFISAQRGHMRRCALGIFQSSNKVSEDWDQPQYLRDAINRELTYFNRRLPVTSGHDDRGICWFRCDALYMIRRARALAFWLEECGLIINELRTACPGEILYRDDYQILAIPAHFTPTKWGQ